ncbi:DivIVA domain-containing protein [Mycobacteroides abscessus]|uniref:DivIVA domain-containing protein n=1 Tax=Mycobacteroides abscessus TaxID=36809 RepID=UPI00078DDB68|nr:DivIVA domain-containing protein [Mycobacteroides abscessus]AMU23231.1 hypothetical protein A3N95_22160 [Mycobacteroides abscessus]
MAITPADVSNVVFSKPRLGSRGYSEKEVDIFLSLVENQMVKHIDAYDALSKQTAKLKKQLSDTNLPQWETQLRDKEAALQQRESALQDKEAALQQRESALQDKEAALQQRESALQSEPGPATELSDTSPSDLTDLTICIKNLQSENSELRRVNGVLKSAVALFSTELDQISGPIESSFPK